jgi:hypothetical protein
MRMCMKATIDHIEGGIAVLVSREDETLRLQIPVSVLPPGSREGDILSVTLERDEEATRLAKAETVSLIEHLRHR